MTAQRAYQPSALWEVKMTMKTYNPGEKAPVSGQYQNPTTKTEVTVVKGEPLPPTPGKGQGYKLVDPTKHKTQK